MLNTDSGKKEDRCMNNNLLILGAGQYGMVAKEIAEAMGCFEKIDFLDDRNEIAVGKLDSYGKYSGEYDCAAVAVGDAEVRFKYLEKLEAAGYDIATLVSPRAYVAQSATLMKGTIVEPMAVVNAFSNVSAGTIICAGAVVNHNAFVGTCCLLQCGSVVAAGAHVTDKTVLNYNEVFTKADIPV